MDKFNKKMHIVVLGVPLGICISGIRFELLALCIQASKLANQIKLIVHFTSSIKFSTVTWETSQIALEFRTLEKDKTDINVITNQILSLKETYISKY